MNIYLIKRSNYGHKEWCDEYDSFVAIAASEQEVRKMHPESEYEDDFGEKCDDYILLPGKYCWYGKVYPEDDPESHNFNSWVDVADIDNLTVTLLGTTEEKFPRIVLASYNAG